MADYKVIMVRHGESVYNEQNRFCGWFDADLAETGYCEAKHAGKMLSEKGITFDLAFTSVLQRAIKTLFFICDEMQLHWVPVIKDWRLNERNYGALTGLNKAETAAEHGEEQVKIWRRAYDVPPPALDENDERYPGNDPRYKGIERHLIPHTECLKDTVERVVPFWQNIIVPEIKRGRKVMIAAHGNSIRALAKYLDGISDDKIVDLNIPTAIPIIYELNGEMKAVKHYYTASDEEVKAAVDKVAAQGKAKSA